MSATKLTKQCKYCYRTFIGHHRSIYCSVDCRNLAYRARRSVKSEQTQPEQSTFMKESDDERERLLHQIRQRRERTGEHNESSPRNIEAPRGADRADRGNGEFVEYGAAERIERPATDSDRVADDDEIDAGRHRAIRREYGASSNGHSGDVESRGRTEQRAHDSSDDGTGPGVKPSGLHIVPMSGDDAHEETVASEDEPETAAIGSMRAKLGVLAHSIDSKPLNKSETEKYREIMKIVFQSGAESLDTFLSYSNRQHTQSEIWALDDEDALILADAWLSVAQRNRQTAYATRAIVATHGNARALMLTGERLVQTYLFYVRNGGFGW